MTPFNAPKPIRKTKSVTISAPKSAVKVKAAVKFANDGSNQAKSKGNTAK